MEFGEPPRGYVAAIGLILLAACQSDSSTSSPLLLRNTKMFAVEGCVPANPALGQLSSRFEYSSIRHSTPVKAAWFYHYTDPNSRIIWNTASSIGCKDVDYLWRDLRLPTHDDHFAVFYGTERANLTNAMIQMSLNMISDDLNETEKILELSKTRYLVAFICSDRNTGESFSIEGRANGEPATIRGVIAVRCDSPSQGDLDKALRRRFAIMAHEATHLAIGIKFGRSDQSTFRVANELLAELVGGSVNRIYFAAPPQAEDQSTLCPMLAEGKRNIPGISFGNGLTVTGDECTADGQCELHATRELRAAMAETIRLAGLPAPPGERVPAASAKAMLDRWGTDAAGLEAWMLSTLQCPAPTAPKASPETGSARLPPP